MRQIQPVNILVKGSDIPANYFDVECIYDNLKTKATFKYSYISVTDYPGMLGSYITEVLKTEEINMGGQDYIDWGNSSDINNEAFVWVANQVNVVLI
jgi:hypothetical protein